MDKGMVMGDGRPRDIRIREMTAADIPQTATLERDVFSEPWSEKGFSDALSMESNIFLVAVKSGKEADADGTDKPTGAASGAVKPAAGSGTICRREKIAGYCGIYIVGDEGEVTNVAVAASDRRRGIGDVMLRELCSRAGQRGVKRIFLEVRVSNLAAVRLYEKHGFVPCGMRRDFYRFPTEDAMCMMLLI